MQDFPSPWYLSDAYLLRKATKKYFIGIGQTMQHYLAANRLTNKFEPYKPNFPLIQIEPDKGFAMLKCPTLSGGLWFSKVQYISHCSTKAPVMEGQLLNVITR